MDIGQFAMSGTRSATALSWMPVAEAQLYLDCPLASPRSRRFELFREAKFYERHYCWMYRRAGFAKLR